MPVLMVPSLLGLPLIPTYQTFCLLLLIHPGQWQAPKMCGTVKAIWAHWPPRDRDRLRPRAFSTSLGIQRSIKVPEIPQQLRGWWSVPGGAQRTLERSRACGTWGVSSTAYSTGRKMRLSLGSASPQALCTVLDNIIHYSVPKGGKQTCQRD